MPAYLPPSQWPQTPESMGFDASDGITMNEDGDTNDPLDPKQSFGITRRAKSYMRKQVEGKHPFYLQLSYYAVHSQPQALASTLKKYQNQAEKTAPAQKKAWGGGALQAAMTEDLDTCIGELLKSLDEMGIADTTYVIYMADNGMRSNGLKGGKTLLDEGGIRVPLVVKGPGVGQGLYCNVPVIGYDIFPTVIDFVAPDAKLPDGIEGGSWRKVLLNNGQGDVKRPIDRLVWHHDVEIEHPQTALRQGNFKLLHYWDTREDFLYDLSSDPGERQNLVGQKPELVKTMLAALKQHVRAGLGENKFEQLESGKIEPGPRGGVGKAATKKGGGRDAAKKKARAKNADQ
jgi:arylsulfatase A-like enzyme